MRISHITIEGFRGVRKRLEIECGKSFTVICGRNGTGKSTICDAVEFAIQGHLGLTEGTERGEYLSDYLWWRGEAPIAQRQVVLRFEGYEGSDFVVERTESELKGEEALGNLIDGTTAPDDWLSELCLTSILRDETITNLSTDRPERERYDFALRAIGLASSASVEKTLGAVVSTLESRKSDAIKNYERERNKVESLTSELSGARISATKATAESLDDLRHKYADELRGGLTDLSALTRIIAQRISQNRNRLAVLERTRTSLARLIERKTEISAQKFEVQVRSFSRKVDELRNEFARAKDAFDKALAELRRHQQNAPAMTTLAAIRQHGSSLGLRDERCPLCGSRISEADFQSHLREIDAEIAKTHGEAAVSVAAERKAKRDLEDTQGRLRNAENQYLQAEGIRDGLEREEALLREAVREVGATLDEQEISHAIEKTSTDIAQRNEDLSVVQAYVSIHRITELEEFLKGAQDTANEAENHLRQVSRALDTAVELKAAANRVSGEVVRERLAALKPLFVELYKRLRPHRHWTEIDFLLRGDVRPFLSFVVGNELNPRFVFSSGQRRALGLVFLLAVHLSRSWCKLETLILDDVIQHVDDYRALHFVETLAALRKAGRQIICTVEDPALGDLLCRRLRSEPNSEGVRIDLDYRATEGVELKSVRRVTPLPERVLAAD